MSKQNIPILSLPKRATAALTADRFVSHTGGLPTAGGNTLGVSRSNAAIGDLATIDILGTAVVEASAAIAEGAAIEALADGRAVTRTTGVITARAIQAAPAAGQFIEVLLIAN